jgi:hypothetical protein
MSALPIRVSYAGRGCIGFGIARYPNTDPPRDTEAYFVTVANANLLLLGVATWGGVWAGQGRAEQSSSLLLETRQHGYSWCQAPTGPMAVFLFACNTITCFGIGPAVQ